MVIEFYSTVRKPKPKLYFESFGQKVFKKYAAF